MKHRCLFFVLGLVALLAVAQGQVAHTALAKTTGKTWAPPRASDARPGSTTPAVVATLDPDLAPLVTAPLEIEPLGVAPLAPAVPIDVDALSIGRIDIAMP